MCIFSTLLCDEQHALLLPVLIQHLLFHKCLDVLEETIDYQFDDRLLLQVVTLLSLCVSNVSAGCIVVAALLCFVCSKQCKCLLGSLLSVVSSLFAAVTCPMWAEQFPFFLHFSTCYSVLQYLLLSLFPISYSLHLFSCFSIPSHSTRIVPLRFQAGCRRKQLRCGFSFFCVLILCYMYFLVKEHACLCLIWFSLVLRCDSCRCQHNNLNEPLDPFPFSGGC